MFLNWKSSKTSIKEVLGKSLAKTFPFSRISSSSSYRMFFAQTSTRPPTHAPKVYQTRKQNNQLPTKSHDELKDNSIVFHIRCPIYVGSFFLRTSWQSYTTRPDGFGKNLEHMLLASWKRGYLPKRPHVAPPTLRVSDFIYTCSRKPKFLEVAQLSST